MPTELGGVAAPERPAAMANDNEAGAQAVAEYFVELYGYAVQSQDLMEFTALCDAASTFCSSVIADVDADVAASIRTSGGATVFEVDQIDLPGERPFYVVWGSVDREPSTVTGANGEVVEDLPADDGVDFATLVEYSGSGRWIVRGAEAGVVPPS